MSNQHGHDDSDDKNQKKKTQRKRNKSIIKKIEAWQDFDYVKPLICKKTREKLVPKIHNKSGKVYLSCPKSNYKQWSIPKIVLETRLVVFDHAKDETPNIEFQKKKTKKDENS